MAAVGVAPQLPLPVTHVVTPPSREDSVSALSDVIQKTYRRSDLVFYANGRRVTVNNPNPDWVLLDWIRAQNNLKGTKLGCGEGGCGACTVVLQEVDPRSRRLKHIAVNSCLFPLVGMDGRSLITTEGLGTVERPHPLHERIAKFHGSQCGFCTPGIVMSLYALIRNSYYNGKFHLTESDIEMKGHLDGNLCRCTGYKPILEAVRSFIVEDLKGEILEEAATKSSESSDSLEEEFTASDKSSRSASSGSCGRPGGCCRDGGGSCGSATDSASTDGSETAPSTVTDATDKTPSLEDMLPYDPTAELLFPPSLWKYEAQPLCFGNEKRIWFKPTTLQQLIELKSVWPAAKIVGGGTETQIETRFKKVNYQVSIFVSDIPELNTLSLPEADAEIDALNELRIPANYPISKVEQLCSTLYKKIGPRASALEALRKQLRFFAGRQIRNVASLAGNLATASPISDSAPVLLAINAKLSIASIKGGTFEIPLSSFYVRYRTTTLPEDAVIVAIVIPLTREAETEVTKGYKQAKRKEDDIAIVTAGLRVRLDKDGLVEDSGFAYGGMAPTTVLASRAQKAVAGKRWADGETLELALDALLQDFDLPMGVPGGMAHYRKTLTLSLFFRFWHESAADLGVSKTNAEMLCEIEREISSGNRSHVAAAETKVVGKRIPHLSALKHCTGEAEYVDDMPQQRNELFAALVISKHARAKIVSVDWTPALDHSGVVGYLDRNSVAAELNDWGPIKMDEKLFAEDEIHAHGQAIGMIYAESALEAEEAAAKVQVSYEVLPPILTIDEAIKANSFFDHGKQLKKGAAVDGSLDDTFSKCAHVFKGTTRLGGQEHFYLETNAALAIPHMEDGSMEVFTSSQNLAENQVFVARVLGVPMSRVNMRVRRMGGAYGGKESRSTPFTCMVALAAKKERRPVRMMLPRDVDIAVSGQRHPMKCEWKVGTDAEGRIICLDADLYDNAGWSLDMSGAVMDRACTHIDNCYHIPHAWIRGHVCKTNTVSNTAFRGFGGPQGMYFAESFMSAISEGLNIDIDELRLRNLYKVGQVTPFLQDITDDFHIGTMLEQLSANADYEARKAAVATFNAANRYKKRGICMIPSKFGLSFATALHLNQAGAYVKIYEDGSVQLHHGGTEMGQGLYTKMCQVAAEELGVSVDEIYTKESQTDQVANPSPTAASSGSDLNGMAVKNACEQLQKRLAPYREKYGPDAPMSVIAHAAYVDRVNLAANGFWKMPRVGFQWGNYKDPLPMYYYWTQGVAITEVELDVLTGDHTVLRSDIMMDIGRSINPGIDYGQIEGAFVQGQGLFTMEESLWTRTGELFTRGPGTYKIPGFGDIPQIFNVSMLQHDSHGKPISWDNLRSIQSSKGVGEPPLFLGSTAYFALREAVKAARAMNEVKEPLVFNAPATSEKLRLAVGDDLARRAAVVAKEGETNFFVRIES